MYTSLSSVSYIISTVVTLGAKLTLRHGSVINGQKRKSVEFSRALSAYLVDFEGFTILFREEWNFTCSVIVYDYSLEQFETCNGSSGVTPG